MKKYKNILRWTLWTAGTLVLFIAMGFVGSRRKHRTCQEVKVMVDEGPGNFFVESKDVMDMLSSRGQKLKGSRLEDINTALLEKNIQANPFIENAEVFSTIDGKIDIRVRQRNPVLRVMNTRSEDFYIDENGVFIPVSEKFTAPVLVANGYIFNTFSERKIYNLECSESDTVTGRQLLEQLFTLANTIRLDTVWNSQIEQLYVNEWQEIEMIPRIGNHRIILGDIGNLHEKLERLMLFYKKGLNNIGWNTYRTINLKFKNQVVCSKF